MKTSIPAQAPLEGAIGPGRAGTAAQARRGALVLAVALVSMNMRGSFVGVGPIIKDIQASIGLPLSALGLLVTLPVVGIGLASPLAPRLARSLGIERTIFFSLLVLTAAALLRSVPDEWAPWLPRFGMLYGGTALLGCSVAIGGVLVPALIRRSFSDRIGPMTAVFVVLFSASGGVAAAIAVPLEHLFGWRVSLALWAVPAAIAALAWGVQSARAAKADREAASRSPLPAAPSAPRAHVNVWRSGLAWAVTGFMGLQSVSFYVIITWLPSVLRDAGESATRAGLITSIFQAACLLSSLSCPFLIGSRRDHRAPAVIVSALATVGIVMMIFAPQWPGSGIVAGIGLGGSLAIVMMLITARSATPEDTGALSGMSQSIGYLVSAVGPIFIGLLHDAAGNWQLPLAVAAVVSVGQIGVSLVAGQPRVMQAHARGKAG